ncbi:hypothetical protein [Azospirillum sp. B510]|uniref:hypothetical protein n=1 Tax=Azospirillum sp. (strain B510) TaxID=137722 RepID=UPI00030B17DD|nr:hypothetical protein [Azospirillum sp. B510]
MRQAADRGLCGDAFASAPDATALAEPPPPPAVTPQRKPQAPDRRIRATGGSHAVGSSPARAARGDDGDFLTNFQRDFHALTSLLGGGSPSRRSTGGTASYPSHDR